MKLLKPLSLVLVVLILGAMALADPTIPAEVGKEAPDFEMELIDGETFKLSEHRGKVVFLNVWATWCPPCVMEIPDIETLSQTYPDDLVVIGISCDDNVEVVEAFLEKNGYTYNFAVDLDFQIGGVLYPSYSIPNSIFIDTEGIVTSIEIGAADYEMLEQRYLEALDQDE